LKILQNPIAVIILALVAVALLGYQLVWPMMQHSHWMQPAPVAASDIASTPNPGPQQQRNSPLAAAAPGNSMPEMKIDAAAAKASATRSTAIPRRDPFQGQLLATSQAKPYPLAREVLTFQGVWKQSGSTLAVINDQVIAVGDSILAFKVESIEGDRVWVEGPNGRESVEFGAHTNSPPPANPDK
jgi:hypothetical protein